MITKTLMRFAPTGDGVFGRMGKWFSIEEEDLNNRPNVSCIPEGLYICRRTRYNRGGYETFEVTNVPGRSHILFHIANTEEDIEGCIGLGTRLGTLRVKDEDTGELRYKLAVLESKKAFQEFMESMKGIDEFMLRVVSYTEPEDD